MTDDHDVWVAGRGTGGKTPKLHTDPDCHLLQAANSTLGPKPRYVFTDDRDRCQVCPAPDGGGD